jgi:hypothetical protein
MPADAAAATFLSRVKKSGRQETSSPKVAVLQSKNKRTKKKEKIS